ncbi:hypothetical protein EGI26_19710 [Lacihabitans sp. CCS-44]|uniref:iron chaperone n=1 Tax=Lacihabitans sp. CCS-44 TaxID=2487331 RepID=UPI0020CF079E|nr:DUF1801 domain-containing protein [Lacihabitans sp. CCS-44]MCP9757393.1 hypothetical protein [Lacihabitans sp. CCS-44]
MEKSTAYTTVDEYIEAFPADVKLRLLQIRELIKSTAPESEEYISYGMPSYKFHGILVYFSAFKNHIGLFSVPNLHPDFLEKFKPYKTGRGSVQFPHNKALPLDFIKEILEFRVSENLKKMK